MKKVQLTKPQAEAVLYAIGNFTTANARDIREMMLCGFTRHGALALLRAEQKIREALRKS